MFPMSRDHSTYRTRVQDIRGEARSLIERLRAERLAKSRFAPKPAPAPEPAAPSAAEIEAWTGGVALLAASAAPQDSAPQEAAFEEAAPMQPGAAVAAAEPAAPKPRKVSAPCKPKAVKPAPAALDAEVPAPPAAVEPPLPEPERPAPVAPAPRRAKAVKRAVREAAPAPAPTPEPETATIPHAALYHRITDALALETLGEHVDEPAPAAPTPIPRPAPAPARAAQPTVKRPARPAVAPAPSRPLRSAPPIAQLPGIGPGMVWRLENLGYKTMADLAEARLEELSARLGAVGRLVKLDRWIDHARRETGAADDAA
jgi:predicted flap endonuclease-1-like 5' DNA nuclease